MFVGFDSLHPLHFSTLQSERFTASMELWGFWFSQQIQWASSEIWRSNSVLPKQLLHLLLLLPHLALDTENGFGAVFGGSDKSKSLPQTEISAAFLMF